MRAIRLLIITTAVLCASLAPALSAYEAPRNAKLIFAVEITQRFKMSSPWTGDLVISVNDEGIVSGQYRSNSIRPDPFHGRTVNVTGGLTGDSIRLSFSTSGRTSARGTISGDGIVATFYDPNNKTYDFKALRVTRE